MRGPERAWMWARYAVFVGFTVTYLHCIDPRTAGYAHDDGEYLIAGRSLAEGTGLRLTNLPGAPPQTRYPPGYPALLALCWSLLPEFPQNILLFKAVSVACAIGGLVLLDRLLRLRAGLSAGAALAIVLFTGSFFHFGVAAVSIMSDAPFFLCCMGALHTAERVVRAPQPGGLALLASLVCACILLRTAGLALAAAVLIALARRREWRACGALSAAVLLVAVLPWSIWVATHSARPATPEAAVVLLPYMSYLDMTARIGEAGAGAIVARAASGVGELAATLLAALVPVVGGVSHSGAAHPSALLALAGFALFGWIAWRLTRARRESGAEVWPLFVGLTMMMISIWYVPESMPRFALPILPFVWLALLAPLDAAVNAPLARRVKLARLALAGLLAATLLPCWSGFAALHVNSERSVVADFPGAQHLWPEYESAFEFVRASLPADAVIASREDVVFHLYTGRRAVYLHSESLGALRAVLDADPSDDEHGNLDALLVALERTGARHIVLEPRRWTGGATVAPNPIPAALLARHPGQFSRVFRSPHGLIEIHELRPAVEQASR